MTSRAIVEHDHVQGITSGHAYLAGLLHDIGRFVLFDQSPEFIRAVDDLAWTTPTELIEAERQICGIDHAELGGRVKLADWLSIWHRSHDGTDEMTEALAVLPEIRATLGEREPSQAAADLAKLLPEMLAAGTRAVHDLGLITRSPG